MAGDIGAQAGKIGALIELLDRHPSQVRVELLDHGLAVDELGTPACDWRDAIAVIECVQPGSPLYLAEYPEDAEDAEWSLTNMLLALVADAAHVLVWQNSRRRRADFPQRIPRPGVVSEEKKTFGNNPIDIDDMQAWLDAKREGVPAAA